VTHNLWAEVAQSDADFRINGEVAVEVAFQRAQSRKRQAMEFLVVGDIERANRRFQEAAGVLAEVLVLDSPAKRQELEAEIALIASMRHEAQRDSNLTSKMMSIDITGSSRSRGRRSA